MKVIESYSDYLIAVRDQSSDLRFVKTEAIQALDNLRRSNPEKYAEYKARQEEAKKPKPSSTQGRAYDKAKYIQEHHEIDVEELRRKARTRMLKDKYGYGLNLDKPTWITEDDLLKSVNQLSISDLITSSGKPVTRQAIIKKCIKIAVDDRRIDETKLRSYVCGLFCSYYNKKFITLPAQVSYEMVKAMINQGAPVEELAEISDEATFNLAKLTSFIYRKAKQMTDSERERIERIAEKKAERKARKKAKLNNKSDEL